ncbi:MAG: VWA domain-containing protein, partial [Planctomycetota bacterium]
MIGLVWHNASWLPLFGGLLGVAGVVFILGWRLRRNQRSLLPGVFANTRSIRPLFTFLGSFLVGIAILDPRWSSETIELPFRGRNVVVLLDASRSMRCQDAAPDRLQVAKTLLGELAESAVGDRFGLIAFAGTPVPKCPPTADPRAFRRALRQIDPQRMPIGGSL